MNSASTFGVEGTRWIQSAKATAQTLLNTFGGAGVGLVLCYCFYGHIIPVGKMVNCTMGSLVSNTAITFLCTAPEVTDQSVKIKLSQSPVDCHRWYFWLHRLPVHDDLGQQAKPRRPLLHLHHPRPLWHMGDAGCWHFCKSQYFTNTTHKKITFQEDDISLGFSFNKYPGIIYGGGYLLGVQVSTGQTPQRPHLSVGEPGQVSTYSRSSESDAGTLHCESDFLSKCCGAD